MKITAVVPIYNVKPAIVASVINDLKNFVAEIIAVNDGSNKKYDYQLPINNYHLLTHEINRGQGAALQTGTDYAIKNGADIIIHFDADGQHQAKDIPSLIKPLQEGSVDIVFGSRYLKRRSNRQIPFTKKYFIHPTAKFVNYLFSGLKLTDAHNGLRAFKAKIAPKLYLSQDRMAHATEYLQLVKKNKIRYTEVAVEIKYNQYGQGISGGFKIFKELIFKI